MTADWSHSPFPRVVAHDQVHTIGSSLGSGGEASGVHRMAPPYDDWVFKKYAKPTPSGPLAQLIAYPDRLGPADLEIVNRHIAWPVAQVEEERGSSVGVIMPAAPSKYWTTFDLLGKPKHQLLELDHLARDAGKQQNIGLPPQTMNDRIRVCAWITSIAALLERSGMVYLDWSFANVLWSTEDHSAYLIDIDSTTFGPRQQIGTHMFDDPLVPMKSTAGLEVDRYRVALLVAWCLTGRSPNYQLMTDDINRLATGRGPAAAVATLVGRTLTATEVGARIPIGQLRDTLRRATHQDQVTREFPMVERSESSWPVLPVAASAAVRRPPPPPVVPPTPSGGGWPANPPVNSQPPRKKRFGVGLAAAAALVIVVLMVFALTSNRTTAAGPTSVPTSPSSVAAGPSSVSISVAPETFAEVPLLPGRIDVPTTAQDGTDDAGNPISYDSSNLYDGDPATCWRMNGDGTGRTITIDLGAPMTVTSVGLIPGYAKQDPTTGVDRFTQNRRVATVTWSADDGVSASQAFTSSPTMQTLPMSAVTRYLRLTIGSVTADGGRDFTAISEIALVGHR